MTSFSAVCFVLLCSASFFVYMLTLKPRPDSHTCFFCFVYLEMSLFPSTISAFSLHGEYAVRSFLNGAFLPCDHGLDF